MARRRQPRARPGDRRRWSASPVGSLVRVVPRAFRAPIEAAAIASGVLLVVAFPACAATGATRCPGTPPCSRSTTCRPRSPCWASVWAVAAAWAVVRIITSEQHPGHDGEGNRDERAPQDRFAQVFARVSSRRSSHRHVRRAPVRLSRTAISLEMTIGVRGCALVRRAVSEEVEVPVLRARRPASARAPSRRPRSRQHWTWRTEPAHDREGRPTGGGDPDERRGRAAGDHPGAVSGVPALPAETIERRQACCAARAPTTGAPRRWCSPTPGGGSGAADSSGPVVLPLTSHAERPWMSL